MKLIEILEAIKQDGYDQKKSNEIAKKYFFNPTFLDMGMAVYNELQDQYKTIINEKENNIKDMTISLSIKDKQIMALKEKIDLLIPKSWSIHDPRQDIIKNFQKDMNDFERENNYLNSIIGKYEKKISESLIASLFLRNIDEKR